MDGGDLSIDRISDLPDPLITEILSLLNPKEAVCTCILSKRWTDLWTSMATLDFDYHIFGYNLKNKFMQFVHCVLNRRGFSPLDKFKLSWPPKYTNNHGIVEECINLAVACMPQVIYISTHTQMFYFNLPDSLFNCGSVKDMSLLGAQTLWEHQPKSVDLPCLQKLELGYMGINNGFIRMLLLGCPVLKELFLTCCRVMFKEINSNVLKKLTLKKCYFSRHASSLTLKNASSLVTADLDFKISYPDNELNLLGGLPNVTSLRLSTTRHFLGLLDKDIINFPTLNNLKSLELGKLDTSYGWNLVACFLQHSPNLNKLVLNFRHVSNYFYCPPKQSKVAAQEVLLGNYCSFQHKFLEIVEIRVKEGSEETVNEVITTLGALVKTIRKIVIL